MTPAPAVVSAPPAASAPAFPRVRPQRLWRAGHRSLWAVSCAGLPEPGEDCTALEARRGGLRLRLGQGYLPVSVGGAGVLWTGGPGRRGPDVLARGSGGGSAGCVDLFALRFPARGGFAVQKLQPCRGGVGPASARAAVAAVDIVYTAADFRGASNAETTIAFVPLRWNGRRFAMDRAAVVARARDADQDNLRLVAAQESLARLAEDPDDPAARRAPGATTALVGLMVTGRADRARAILHAAWPLRWDPASHAPRPVAGEEAFWRELCQTVIADRLWRDLQLGRLPHGAEVEAAARAATPG